MEKLKPRTAPSFTQSMTRPDALSLKSWERSRSNSTAPGFVTPRICQWLTTPERRKRRNNVRVFKTHFDNQQGSCFKKLVDYADERWASGIGFFSALCVVVLFGMIYTCCICTHKEVKDREREQSNKH